MTVVGDGSLAEALRSTFALSAADVAVLVPPIRAQAKPFVEVEDDEFAAVWEQPMQWAIAALQDAGIRVAQSPADMGAALKAALGR